MSNLPILGQKQQVPIAFAALLAGRPPGLPPEFVTAADLMAAIRDVVEKEVRQVVREECDQALAAALALSNG